MTDRTLRGGSDPDRDAEDDHETHRAYRLLAAAVWARAWKRDTHDPGPPSGSAIDPTPPNQGDNQS